MLACDIFWFSKVQSGRGAENGVAVLVRLLLILIKNIVPKNFTKKNFSRKYIYSQQAHTELQRGTCTAHKEVRAQRCVQNRVRPHLTSWLETWKRDHKYVLRFSLDFSSKKGVGRKPHVDIGGFFWMEGHKNNSFTKFCGTPSLPRKFDEIPRSFGFVPW